jgi:putative AdoMet-dependent methyltransferase
MNDENKPTQFDRWSATYDTDVVDDGLFPFDGYPRVLARVLELAAVRPGLALLELGPGTGNMTHKLAANGADVWGLDFSAEMLAIAHRKVPQAQLAQADLLGSFPEAFQRSFDRVVATYVFHEFPLANKIALLQRLFRDYLVPEGSVVIGDIGFPDLAALEHVRATVGDRWDEEYYWLAEETEKALRPLNLTVIFEQVSSCGVVLDIRRE